jgi:hypothetical protein
MQGDTETRNFTLEDGNGVINLSKYYPNIYLCMDDNHGHYYEIQCSKQSSSRENYKSLSDGGIAVTFTATHLSSYGYYDGQFVLTDSTGEATYPLGDPLKIIIQKKIKRS